MHAASNSADTAPAVITEKRLTTTSFLNRDLLQVQHHTESELHEQNVLDASFYKNDITQSLIRAVRRDSEMSNRVKKGIFHLLTTSHTESEEEKSAK